MEHFYQNEQLPSGKLVIRHFGEDGFLIEEFHLYGGCAIGITYNFKDGVKVDESYYSKGRTVTRRTYEKARASYPDMPAADATLTDSGAKLLRAVSRERRERSAEAKRRVANPDEARKNDEFCQCLMNTGKRQNAVEWIKIGSHTLGERGWLASRRLIERLSSLGCGQIYACEINSDGDSDENTGHLVVHLPSTVDARIKILKAIDDLAGESGYSGPFDDGQQFAYVKLD